MAKKMNRRSRIKLERLVHQHLTNGGWFWQIERGGRNWVRLTKIKKAGTPMYVR